jgi:glycosyltransferase involved in cell wall biosynthesis
VRIEPVPAGAARPLWSVMIPTFNCAKYLRQTLESVLAQDPGPEQMQIEIVDDCSTKDDPAAIVRELGKDRVLFHRKAKNEGAVANFNTCVQRSRGKLVHILHGDDYVLPGFYQHVARQAAVHPGVAAFFVRSFGVEEDGALHSLSPRVQELETPGRALDEMFYSNSILTPGVVMRRAFYEQHGGFLPALIHVADWEMWTRGIYLGGGLFLNEALAAYRHFPGNDTGRLARTGENLRDCIRLADVFEELSPKFDRAKFTCGIAYRAHGQAAKFRKAGDAGAADANQKLWRELAPLSHRARKLARATTRKLFRG